MTDRDKLIKSCQTCLHNNVCKYTDEELCKGTKVKDLITDCKDYFANGVTVNEWISVEERLPEKWQDVLIVTKHGDVRVDFIGILGGWYDAKEVTYWMPLPQPPKEVE